MRLCRQLMPNQTPGTREFDLDTSFQEEGFYTKPQVFPVSIRTTAAYTSYWEDIPSLFGGRA